MQHAHFVRGPTPVTVLVEETSNKVAASSRHLTEPVPPAAREALGVILQGRTDEIRGGGMKRFKPEMSAATREEIR